MSTNWAFECLSHDPPVKSNYFTSHTNDMWFHGAISLAGRRPLMSDDELEAQGVDSYSRSDDLSPHHIHPRRFLLAHPTCKLGLVNEYGQHETIEEFTTEKING
jgi:hypothetical protein